jgi:hypothetical protein
MILSSTRVLLVPNTNKGCYTLSIGVGHPRVHQSFVLGLQTFGNISSKEVYVKVAATAVVVKRPLSTLVFHRKDNKVLIFITL